MQQVEQLLKPIGSPPTEAKTQSSLSNRGKQILGLLAYIAQRLAFGLLVVLSLIYLTLLGLDLARGVSTAAALGRAWTKTIAYISTLLTGDLGLTAAGTIAGVPTPVSEVLPALLLKSLGLLGVSLLLATTVGVVFGLLAARRQNSGWSTGIIVISIIGVSAPSFFAAIILQTLLIQWARRMGAPLLPLGGFGWDKHIILPALVLAARPVAQITRITFVSISGIFGQDYIRVARSKGLHSLSVLSRHVIRNAAIPILTTVGLSLRFSLSSLPVVELFFGWPGVGWALLKSISQKDDNLTVALIVSMGVVFILVNLILEISYRFIDPRLRETVKNVGSGSREAFRIKLQNFSADLKSILTDNAIANYFKKSDTSYDNSIKAVLAKRGTNTAGTRQKDSIAARRRRTFAKAVAGNWPFLIGSILVLAMLVVVAFGPVLAPHSPYTTQGLVIENGQMSVPPFAPDNTYPWGTDALGRDVMSLILAGAQQTLVLATIVVLARLLVGVTLGAIAGWFSGSLADRLILSAAEILAAFPALLLTMILILAIGIRQGMTPFIIAFCFAGWGEVMQYVRSEVMAIRPKPFIESAVSVGLRTPRIVVSHVIPILMSALISIAALEMGAVLMLLGELGFISIFIGGGLFAELEIDLPPYHYSDVPEWGALLSNVRAYARSYIWMAIYPAAAFFFAILGFNLFGEGLRRLVEQTGLNIIKAFNRYTFALAIAALLAFNWFGANSGAVAFYRQQAQVFDGQKALAHAQILADPSLEGRALGAEKMDVAAQYIARQFEAAGLQPAGEKSGFFYLRKRSFQQLSDVPQLSLTDGGPAPVYHQDYTPYPGRNRNLGEAEGAARVITTGPLRRVGFFRRNIPALKDLEYPENILMVLSSRDASFMETVPRGGVLVVADNEAELTRNHTLSNRDPVDVAFGTGRAIGQDAPVMWINAATADRILAGTGQTVDSLRLISEGLLEEQIINFETFQQVSISITGTLESRFPTNQVIGFWPGAAGSAGGQSQDAQMIVVMAQYDSPPLDPDGLPRDAANDNAGGVAVMLEAVRAMQESGYQPLRTLLFVAYAAEGLEGGEDVSKPDPAKFLQGKIGFASAYEIKAVVDLRGLGAGSGDALALSTGGSQRLADLFESAAAQAGVNAVRVDEAVDLKRIFDEESASQDSQESPKISLSWEGWEETSRTPADTLDAVSAEKLEQAGRTLALALMIMGRENEY